MSFVHITKDGDQIPLHELKDDHLQNIINHIRRRAKDGIVVRNGGGITADDFWYDEEHPYGEDALKKMHYDEYVSEQKRRQTPPIKEK